jgi:MFS family permease
MFLAALDQTVISTASPTIATALGHLSSQSWLITSYLGTTLITTPIYGRLSDGFGRRRLFTIALSLFFVGSIICMIAGSFSTFVIGRSVQGLGAGGLFSLAFAVIADLVPPRERGRYTLFFVAIFGSASLLGPVIFGVAGWRWIFALNLPLALAAILLALRYLHVPQQLSRQPLDLAGVLSFAVFIVALLGLSESSNSPLLASVRVWLAIVGVISLAGFMYIERRMQDRAFVPLHFFRNRLFAITVAVSGIDHRSALHPVDRPSQVRRICHDGRFASAAYGLWQSLWLWFWQSNNFQIRTLSRTCFFRACLVCIRILPSCLYSRFRVCRDCHCRFLSWRGIGTRYPVCICRRPLCTRR